MGSLLIIGNFQREEPIEATGRFDNRFALAEQQERQSERDESVPFLALREQIRWQERLPAPWQERWRERRFRWEWRIRLSPDWRTCR